MSYKTLLVLVLCNPIKATWTDHCNAQSFVMEWRRVNYLFQGLHFVIFIQNVLMSVMILNVVFKVLSIN